MLEEFEALWSCVFGQPPCIKAEAAVLAQILVKTLPLAPPYLPGVGRDDASAAIYARCAEG